MFSLPYLQFAPPELLFRVPDHLLEGSGGGQNPDSTTAVVTVTDLDGTTVAIHPDGTIARTPPPLPASPPPIAAAAHATPSSATPLPSAPPAPPALVARVPGGAGWRVRAVDGTGRPLDPRLASATSPAFSALSASLAFDMWGYGALLFELLTRTGLWHADVDSNLSRTEDYANLARWSGDDAKLAVARIPDRWAQALLVRLLAPNPSARPRGMDLVLRHPFFARGVAFEAPPLDAAKGERTHLFLSHFQGNAVRSAFLFALPRSSSWFVSSFR